MFLATTSLTEFWDKNQELLFLGQWCLPREKTAQWQGVRGSILPSPWDEPGRSEWLVRQCSEDVPERLVDFLGSFLNENLGINRTPRYWRVLLRPWALAHIAAVADRWLHLDAAFRRQPGLQTLSLDQRDFATPRDTASHRAMLGSDAYNLQLYTEIMEGMARSSPRQRLPANAAPPKRAPRTESARTMLGEVLLGAGKLVRQWREPDAYFTGLGLADREQWSLVKLSEGKFWPVGDSLPADMDFAPEASRREKLSRFPAHDELDRLVARTLPNHFPTLFLEGYHRWREFVVAGWSRPPLRLLTGPGWTADEYAKMLAAEGIERGGRVAVLQGDGASALGQGPDAERHERGVVDELWTTGWTEPEAAGAALKPVACPRFLRPALKTGKKPPQEVALAGCSLPRYPYPAGFDRFPAEHRFYDYLKQRHAYFSALPADSRRGFTLHVDAPDHGWGHRERLNSRFPGLNFSTAPWRSRLDALRLVVLDSPAAGVPEAFSSGVPVLLFWDPALWRSRAAASEALDGLRRAHILHDTPQAAAAKTVEVLRDPAFWWQTEAVRTARERFCKLFAKSDPNWAAAWIKAAKEI